MTLVAFERCFPTLAKIGWFPIAVSDGKMQLDGKTQGRKICFARRDLCVQLILDIEAKALQFYYAGPPFACKVQSLVDCPPPIALSDINVTGRDWVDIVKTMAKDQEQSARDCARLGAELISFAQVPMDSL